MKDAKRGFNSNRLTEGDYVVRVDRCDFFEHERDGEAYKVTLTILAVNDGPHKEGEVATVTFWKKSGGPKTWFSNIKSFIAPVMGVADEAIGDVETAQTLDPEQVMAGTVCRVKATLRTSQSTKRKDGSAAEYSIYTWYAQLNDGEIVKVLGDERVARHFPNGLGAE